MFTEEQCRYVFDNRKIFHQWYYYYWSQFYGMLIKTLRVHYCRWRLTLLIILLPIIQNLLYNLNSQKQIIDGTFNMQTKLLNPQTILFISDPFMETYIQAIHTSKSNDLILEKRLEKNLSEINNYIWRKF